MSLSQAAVLADEFVLTHKPAHVFATSPTTQFRKSVSLPLRFREERECFYCHELGHLIADCQLRMRNHPPPVQQPKGVVERAAKYSFSLCGSYAECVHF